MTWLMVLTHVLLQISAATGTKKENHEYINYSVQIQSIKSHKNQSTKYRQNITLNTISEL